MQHLEVAVALVAPALVILGGGRHLQTIDPNFLPPEAAAKTNVVF